ncbi:MAG: twin-arginine translocase subunit TatB [Sphingomonas sp.]
MFDIAPSELLVLGTVALLVIPPKDLPKAMRVAGYWVGRARGAARQFRSGFDNIVREAELQEMEKKWAAENERIMREHPPTPEQTVMMPLPAPIEHDAGEDAPMLVQAPEVAPPEEIQAPNAEAVKPSGEGAAP